MSDRPSSSTYVEGQVSHPGKRARQGSALSGPGVRLDDNEREGTSDVANNWSEDGAPRTSGPSHQCPRCRKHFNRPSSLRIHMNTHTGAKPFKCPYPQCGREFNVNSNMRRHLHTHLRDRESPVQVNTSQ
ncbi:hypothetical protein PLICRDRAFT_104604 [Plicaturopsis crispa FD-325 SS-3]|nr:hypothetical protein PLICRDRAFT_104604 [Plicaturopsis crispa FD-325 SS-3]